MKIRKLFDRFVKHDRGMVGIEAAIVLIAFVIIAAAFAFMVVNMGLLATQSAKSTIQQGITEASSPLMTDGSIYVRASSQKVDAMIIPLTTIGTAYVSMAQNSTIVTLTVQNRTALANIYNGINSTNPYSASFDTLVTALGNSTGAQLFIGNSDGSSTLDYGETGFLAIYFSTADQPAPGEHTFIDIRPSGGAPLSIAIFVPPNLSNGWQTVGS
jgi:flagellin FlaB